MNILSFGIEFLLLIVFCVFPFSIYLFVMIFLNKKIGSWYASKVKSLNEKDLSVLAIRNMASTLVILALFFLPIIAYVVFRPSFFDPSWNCFLLAGAVVSIAAFQVFQYLWLSYRTKNKK